jgi:hypothetical protein
MNILDKLRRLGAAVAFAECGEFVTALEIADSRNCSPAQISTFLSDIGLDCCKVRLITVSV